MYAARNFPLILLAIGIFAVTTFFSENEKVAAQNPRVFTSYQIGTSPQNGYVLSTNGATSTWVATSSLGIVGGGGSVGFPFTVTGYGVSTSTTVGFTNGILVGASSTFTTFPSLPLTQGYTLRGSAGNTAEATSSLFVAANGNVGVGTVSPGQKLEVAGNILLSGQNTNLGTAQLTHHTNNFLYVRGGTSGLVLSDDAGNNTIQITDSGFITFETNNGSEKMRITSSGNVGIGTTNPQYKLEVNGSASTTNFYMPNTTSSSLGVIYKGTDRFIHNYADPTSDGYNTFIGINAGNFTMGPGGGASYLGSYNTAVGQNALFSNTTGQTNVALGVLSLGYNTTGSSNTALGYNTLESNTIGNENTAVGRYALYYNTTGSNNTANGVSALISNTTGSYNTANGMQALYYNQSATNTAAFGFEAGRGTTNYSNQGGVYVGYQSGYSAGTGSDYNNFVGYQAGYNTIDGTYNTALGYRALYSATSSDNAVAIGREALYNHLNSQYNTAIGYRALYTATSSEFNTAVGYQALTNNTTGNQNTANGAYALSYNTTGSNNTANGYYALLYNTTGVWNTADGLGALQSNTTGGANTAIGGNALYLNTTGTDNNAIGSAALSANTTGSLNTVNGRYAALSNITGSYNTVDGAYALRYNQSATNTTALGYQAGSGTANYSNQGGVYVGYQSGYSAGTGSNYNTMLGYQSGYGVTTGANNILLGANAGYSGTNLTTGSNNIIIGYNIGATSSDMTRGLNIGNLIFGTGLDGSGTTLSTGNVGIGTTTPYKKLSVVGEVVADTYTATSTTATSTMPLLSVTALSLAGDYIANTTSWFLAKLQAVSSFVAAAASTWDFGGAATLEIPNGSAVFTNTTGQIAVDTTSGQLRWNGGSGTSTIPAFTTKSFTFASTTALVGTTTIPLGPAFYAETWNQVKCFTDTGTADIMFGDGTNKMNSLNASTTVGTVTLVNNTSFTAGEKRYVDIGNPASSPMQISCTATIRYDSD